MSQNGTSNRGKVPGFFVVSFPDTGRGSTELAEVRTQDVRPVPFDFFGFFGALKKGDFFGLHPKKVFLNKSRSAAPNSSLGNTLFRNSIWRSAYVEPMHPKVGFGPLRVSSSELVTDQQSGLFWGGPKKSRSAPWQNPKTPNGSHACVRASSGPERNRPLEKNLALNSVAVCCFAIRKILLWKCPRIPVKLALEINTNARAEPKSNIPAARRLKRVTTVW
jgi:hypothetical protein